MKYIKNSFYFLLLTLLTSVNVFAQYTEKHYIAPAPWQYWSEANEIVVSTAEPNEVTVVLTKSDGSYLTTFTVLPDSPVSFIFEGTASALTRNQTNTTYNDRGLIVEATAPVMVNLRNIASEAPGLINAMIKGNASLVSFGNEGVGLAFRLGYNRTSYTGLNTGRPVYSVMVLEDETYRFLNVAFQFTLHEGQSRLFTAAVGSLLTSSKGVVANVGSYGDTPQACGGSGEDGTFDQIAPNNVLGRQFVVVRGDGQAGTGDNHPEQTTIVAAE